MIKDFYVKDRAMKMNKEWLAQTYLYYHANEFPLQTTGLTYFALTDALIHYSAEVKQPIVYFWPTDNIIFLGMVDTKLPFLTDALSVFDEANYQYIVRNSGGLAVVSDPGVLNFSIIFPEEETGRLKINDAYERMHAIISTTLKPYGVTVEAKEIPESYCPGDYDLSINGRKIAGISQRRIKGGLAIMIYISMDGIQNERSLLVKEFYTKGLQTKEVKWHYPDIDPTVMTTVSDEMNDTLSVDKMIQLINELFAHHGSIVTGEYTEQIMKHYDEAYTKMVNRNQKMLGSLFNEEEHLHEY